MDLKDCMIWVQRIHQYYEPRWGIKEIQVWTLPLVKSEKVGIVNVIIHIDEMLPIGYKQMLLDKL